MGKMYRLVFCILIFSSIVQKCQSQICYDCGDGSSGVFQTFKDTTLPAGTYHFSDFYVGEGAIVKFSGGSAVILRCKNAFILDGIIDLSGGNGGSGTSDLTPPASGQGNAGGFNGAAGIRSNSYQAGGSGSGPGAGPGGSTGGGGGAGHANAYSHCATGAGQLYGDSTLTYLFGGSGGGSGASLSDGVSGSGGGGGGIISIYACQAIIIGSTGKILAQGGQGGDSYLYAGGGGGGSGGSIFLTGKTIHLDGLVSVTGGAGGRCLADTASCLQGGNGGDGRIRMDVYERTGSGVILPGYFEKQLFNAGISRVVDAKCANTATGFIKARSTGGEKPYSYLWSNGSTSGEISNLSKGVYTVTITDGTGCSVTEQTTVAEPSPVSIAVNAYPPTCENLMDGVALYHADGGTPFPYTNYLSTTKWSNQQANGLLFTFQSKSTIRLNHITILLSQYGQQHIEVYYRAGNATAFANTAAQWQKIVDQQFTTQHTEDEHMIDLSMLTGLQQGNHTLYIYSYNSPMLGVSSRVLGSTFNFDHLVDLYAGMARGPSTDPFAAPSTGIMNLSGRLSYTVTSPNGSSYLFQNNGITTAQHTGIRPGSHTVTTTDALGCSGSNTFTVPASDAINIEETSVISPRCHNSSDGSITVNVSSSDIDAYATTPIPSTLPHQGVLLQFSNTSEISLRDIDLYTSGVNTVSVYLKRGSYTTTFNDPSQWMFLGNFPLPAQGSNRISTLHFNTPPVLVPDQWSLRIQADQGVIHLLDQRENFLQTGLLYLNSSGFTSSGNLATTVLLPNSYFAGSLHYQLQPGTLFTQWNNSATGYNLSGLREGDYTLTVSYLQQCSSSKTISLDAPDSIQIRSSVIQETDDEGNGVIRVDINGGTPPYYISWPEQMETGTLLSGLSMGTYPLFIADAKGCIYRDTIQVGKFNSPIKEEGWLTLVPNPGEGYIKIGDEVKGMENCSLRIFDMLGRLSYQTSTTISQLMTAGLDLHHYADGTYLIQVSDEDQVFQQRAIIIR